MDQARAHPDAATNANRTGSAYTGGRQATPTDERLILALQRSAGNRAVASILGAAPGTRRPSAPLAGLVDLQRQAVPPGADPDLVARINALVTAISGEAGEFETYKRAPLEGAKLPGKKTQAALRKMDAPPESWIPRYVRAKLGPARLKLVQEMIGMSGFSFTNAEELLGVAHQSPGHQYRCELKAAKTLKERVIEKITPIVTITYTNAFGWNWKRDYSLAAVEISAGAKASKEKGKKPSVKPGGGIGPLELDISGTASADPVPIRYWGGNDFTGGVLVAKLAGKAKVGPAGGKVPGLTAITFTGGPFGTISFPFINGLSGSISGGGKGASAEVGIGMGVGGSIGLGETEVTPPPELREERRLTKTFQTWTLNVGPFETGKAEPPEVARESLQALHDHIVDWRRRWLDPQADDLRKEGVDPETNFKLTFYLTGTTSRSWRGAATDRQRLERNERLGLDRAIALTKDVNDVFGGLAKAAHAFSGGTATKGPSTTERPAEYLTDEETEKEYKRLREEVLQIKDPEERRLRLEAIENNFGKQSDQPYGRRVLVLARWEGQRIIKALVPVPRAPGP